MASADAAAADGDGGTDAAPAQVVTVPPDGILHDDAVVGGLRCALARPPLAGALPCSSGVGLQVLVWLLSARV